MKLVVENCPEKEGVLRQAFNITCNQLGIAPYNWTVTLRFDPQSVMCDENTGGQTKSIGVNNQCFIQISTRLLNPLAFSRLIEVFCHELVHVKQIIRDGLEGSPEGVRFKGKIHSVEELMFANVLFPFPTEPWEIEAYSRDKGLAATVLKFLSR